MVPIPMCTPLGGGGPMGPEAMRALVEHISAQWPEQLSGLQDTGLVIAAVQCGHCEPHALEHLLPALH